MSEPSSSSAGAVSAPNAAASASSTSAPSPEEWAQFQAWKEEQRRKEMAEFEQWRASQQGQAQQQPQQAETKAVEAAASSGPVVVQETPAPTPSALAPPTYEQTIAASATTAAPARAPSPSLSQILAPTGATVSKTEPCPQCKGKGKWNPNGGLIPFLAEKIAPSSVLETCPHCKGTGQLVTKSYKVIPGQQIGDNVRMGMVGMVGPGGQMSVAPIVSTTGSRVGFVG